jgi:hypothetical protein
VRLIAAAFSLGPILFGIGFLAPVMAASLRFFGVIEIAGSHPIYACLVAGAAMGLVARQRGTWLW